MATAKLSNWAFKWKDRELFVSTDYVKGNPTQSRISGRVENESPYITDNFISLDVEEIVCSEDKIEVVKCVDGTIYILEPTQDIHYSNYFKDIEIENLKSKVQELIESLAQVSLCESLSNKVSEEYTLRNYMWANFSMTGKVYNHPRFSDGEIITTSRIHKIEYSSLGVPEKIFTKNSIYKLIK